MKKYVWLLIAAAFAVAVLAMVGCRPAETPAASPSPSPTVTPTPDTNCPKVVSTVVEKAYGTDGTNFKITVTFDEPIVSGCIEDPSKWSITVKNSGRKDKEITKNDGVVVNGVSLSPDLKKAIVKAAVTEKITYAVLYAVYDTVTGDVYEYYGTVKKDFSGLICSEDDAKRYADPGLKAGDLGIDTEEEDLVGYAITNVSAPTVADTVVWKLEGCVVCDELGYCCCDYSDSDCCLEPTCPTCVEECPLGSAGQCPQ